MPSNIEIKARVSDLTEKRRLAERLTNEPPVLLQQQDTYFHCEKGRLKLRWLSDTRGELIFYSRPDIIGTKQSDYSICETTSPSALLTVLSAALGTKGVVTKTRLLYVVGQTRIHLDTVAGLGSFLELEVVMTNGQIAEDAHHIARELMTLLQINDNDLLECSYADLIACKL